MSNSLYVAWRAGSAQQGVWSPVGKLEHINGLYRFRYTRGAASAEGFPGFVGMDNFRGVYESEELFPLFANRLLSKKRPEYEAWLTWSGFDAANPPEPLAILGVTEGIRQTDQVEVFPCPVPDDDGCYLTRFFLHGLRWVPAAALERIGMLQSGEQLGILFDVQNPVDPHAVALRTMEGERYLIGYVPRYLAYEFGRLTRECSFAEIRVERLNPGAPMQMRVLCRMNACWPDHFRPCEDDVFQPIVRVPSDAGVPVCA
jgi:HIRAN domain